MKIKNIKEDILNHLHLRSYLMLNKKNINLNHLIKVREHTLHEAWRAMDRKGGLGVVKELRAAAVLNTHCNIPGKI